MAHERDLLAMVARRDEASFQQLYEEFATRIFRYTLTLLRDRHLAEEVVQETMTTVWSKKPRPSGTGLFKTTATAPASPPYLCETECTS